MSELLIVLYWMTLGCLLLRGWQCVPELWTSHSARAVCDKQQQLWLACIRSRVLTISTWRTEDGRWRRLTRKLGGGGGGWAIKQTRHHFHSTEYINLLWPQDARVTWILSKFNLDRRGAGGRGGGGQKTMVIILTIIRLWNAREESSRGIKLGLGMVPKSSSFNGFRIG